MNAKQFREFPVKALLALLSALTAIVLAPSVAHADSQKPKETPTEVVSFDFSKISKTLVW